MRVYRMKTIFISAHPHFFYFSFSELLRCFFTFFVIFEPTYLKLLLSDKNIANE